MSRRAFFDTDLKAGLKTGLFVGLAIVLLVLLLQGGRAVVDPGRVATPLPAPPVVQPLVDFGDEAAADDVRRLAQWIVVSGDHGGRSFALVDKREAKLFVFEADGRLAAAAPVLLGSAVGDDTAPQAAARALVLRPEERTTPAGRFVSQAGRNAQHEQVVWVDYGAAVSMHRVRLTHPAERRLQRLASPTVADNRISAGCINLPADFFDRIVWPRFGDGQQGVVYVLPETRPLDTTFALPTMAGG